MADGPILDLGRFEAPILVFGGPYGNLEATRAVLAEADRMNIPASRVLCTGDVCAYCADPQETVDLLRAAGIVTVMGNCEESLAGDDADCGCGFASGSACDVLSQQWFAYAAAHLDAGAKAWMRTLPRQIAFRLAGRRFRVIHGGASRINRFVFASTPEDEIAEEFRRLDADAAIAGHCGLPFSRVVGGRLWHNAGVVGMPANDGTPRGWYGVLRPEGGDIAIEHRAFGYDHTAQVRKMRERGLPEGYARGLETGLWPNLDILPVAERQRTGRPIAADTVVRWPAGGETAAGDRSQRQADLRIT